MVAIVLGGAVAYKLTRKLGLVVAMIVVVGGAGSTAPWPNTPTVTVLDVGQGDAIVLQDPSGRSMLIDGGPDPGLVDRALRRHGISRLDIVVVTHGDADHVGGIGEVVGAFDVGALWVNAHAGSSDLLQGVIDTALKRQIPIVEVEAGTHAALGEINVEVVSPSRKFSSDNDGSVVILATAGRSVLIPGDIEAIGQAELPELHPNILIVPHHGSSSTDIHWLASVIGDTAVVSYGTNTYGHPHPDIMSALDAAQTEIFETFIDGDVSVDLSKDG
jgi:competence protein ComEC